MSEHVPPTILAHYGGELAARSWIPLVHAGGFSGAKLWRAECRDGSHAVALKYWPPAMTAERLGRIHEWMNHAAHLDFVPAVVRTADGGTVVRDARRVWDICRWMPGEPKLTSAALVPHLENAAAAVAALHNCWEPQSVRAAPIPAVSNRLLMLSEFRRGHFTPATIGPERVNDTRNPLIRARHAVLDHVSRAEAALRPWSSVSLPLRPCVRDLRAEHVLFTGDRVTGIIDFGAMDLDHAATDLARLLGESVGEDEPALRLALVAYHAHGGDSTVTLDLVRTLEYTGTVCSLIGWLRRISLAGNDRALPHAVIDRIEELRLRLENARRA